jgi:hypothetical protein
MVVKIIFILFIKLLGRLGRCLQIIKKKADPSPGGAVCLIFLLSRLAFL